MFKSLFSSKPVPMPTITAEELAARAVKKQADDDWHQWERDYEAYSPVTNWELCFGPSTNARFGQLLAEIVELKRRVAELEGARS